MKYVTKIINRYSAFDKKISNSLILVSLRKGFISIIPLILIGSFALLIMSLPIPAYQALMVEMFGSQWKNILIYIRDGTSNILSLVMVISISYAYVVEARERRGYAVNPLIVALIALGSFIAITGISKDSFSMTSFGVNGIFVAMLVAITSSMLFLKLSSMNLFQMRAFTDGASASFNYALTSIFPGSLTIIVFASINQLLHSFLEISNIHIFFSDIVVYIFATVESSEGIAFLFILFVHIFWFFGIHGSNVLEPVTQSILIPALESNQLALLQGQLPTEVFTKPFFNAFTLMGGCGTTLALMLAILVFGKYENQRRLAKMSFLPVVFNINELLVFGIPIVFNFSLLLPFLLVPVILTTISYFAIISGLVPYTNQAVEWTTPIFLSGYVATGSIKGSILQLVNLIVAMLCYLPFIKLAENVSNMHMKNNLNKVASLFQQGEERGVTYTMLNRYDSVGNVARFLVVNLKEDLQKGNLSLFYQPQVNFRGEVCGLEALLRWEYGSYGYMYPPLVISLAEEAQMLDELGYWILDTACRDLKKMDDHGLAHLTVAVNISAAQIENDMFIDNVKAIINKYQIHPQNLEIEITEQMALGNSERISSRILALKELGVKLAMDDFGMGHSSLMYLKEYQFDTIKLDGSLVREVVSNQNCRNIISSIVSLGNSLHYSVIAEYVESTDQRHLLHELGCDLYQGYLYSKPLPYEQAIEYILKKNKGSYLSQHPLEICNISNDSSIPDTMQHL